MSAKEKPSINVNRKQTERVKLKIRRFLFSDFELKQF